jgi:RimJ/RimL family protein N-acetyltransferase
VRAIETAERVSLRAVLEEDLQTLFEHQLDPDAIRMAAFPPRDEEAHFAHWRKILADDSVIAATVLFDGQIAGNIGSWDDEGERLVGYWIGKSFWGKGIATAALARFIDRFDTRPLRAHVAEHNVASLRVLEKSGFRIVGKRRDGDVDELILSLES